MHKTNTADEGCQTLRARLAEARAHTDDLFRLLRPEAFSERPIPARHRLIFYLGHLEAFDWNLLGRGTFDLPSFHPTFDRLFAFGIDPISGGLPDDKPSDWPTIGEIEEYNRRVRHTLDAALQESSWSDPRRPYLAHGLVVHAAIEHRLMHGETLAYLLHQLPTEQKQKVSDHPNGQAQPVTPHLVEIPEGSATLGTPRGESRGFAWDNEYEAHQVKVPAFAIDAYPVTNGQYLDFLRASGYEDRSLWTDADWQWKAEQGVQHPLFWSHRGGRWLYRAMFGETPLPLDWPVYVSHAEAAAYARWAGKSLPIEAQWHRAAYGTPQGRERMFPWGEEPPDAARGNFDFQRWNPTSVAAHPAGASAFGAADLMGNGWEWTHTPFAPFPGFEPYPFYPGYSANFFDGQHYVMKGGSSRTAACLLRRSFRNWFQPHYPYVYAKFRCVRN